MLDPLYTVNLTSFLVLYKYKFSNTQPHLVVKNTKLANFSFFACADCRIQGAKINHEHCHIGSLGTQSMFREGSTTQVVEYMELRLATSTAISQPQ